MSSDAALNLSEHENACVVCFKSVEIYSIGVCDHPVCYECSTRMRVLCKQNECPICRGDLPKVIFTKDVESFNALKTKVERSNLLDVKYGLYFCSPSIQRAYHRLLEFNCPVCYPREQSWPFKSFTQLKDHMRRNHELFYCDLCVDNLKIFAFERKCYSRSELAQHRRKGDTDNTSHRGHPLCEFCDQRYMDSDELYRHLRRDHLYCHICDADGKHQYYSTYDDLRLHFLDEHYLCEEGECKNEQLTSVFRTDIDLKAHIASVHSKHLSRAANKLARTLEVQFNFGPRRADYTSQKGSKRPQHRNYDIVDGAVGGYEQFNVEPGGATQLFINPLQDANFPTLGNSNEAPTNAGTSRTSVTFTSKITPNFTGDEFPTLGGATNRNLPTSANQKGKKAEDFPSLGGSRNITITKTSASVSGAVSTSGLQRNSQNFPALNEATSNTLKFTLNQDRQQSSAGPNVSIHVNHKSNGAVTTRITTAPTSTIQIRPKTMEAFPALCSASTPAPVQQWVQPKSKKQDKPKPAPAPSIPSNTLSDFPTLSKKSDSKSKKTSSVMLPVNNSWVHTNNNQNELTNRNSISHNPELKKEKSKKKTNEIRMVDSTPIELIETKSKGKGKKKSKILDGVALQTGSSSNVENPHRTINLITHDKVDSLSKKTSTLKIGLEYQTNGDDFPFLKKPPPGFTVKPPPGFNFLPKNDLTFTNSSGQSYPILPAHTFSQPQNFSNRNTNLIQNFLSVLKTSEAINEFKSYSDLYRNGGYPAEKYYEHCKCVLGNSFDKIFPELLVLLPNIEKQQELFRVHKKRSNVRGLEECATCKQVIYDKELKQHLNNHYMENHFPSLGNSLEMNNVWKK